jgi:hypothetical protein
MQYRLVRLWLYSTVEAQDPKDTFLRRTPHGMKYGIFQPSELFDFERTHISKNTG